MCKIMEKLVNQGVNKGREEGQKETEEATILRLAQGGAKTSIGNRLDNG